MSFLTKVFVSKKEPKALSPQEAIMKVRETENLLIKKQEFLEQKVDKELELAQKHAKTNKRIALNALKRKNRYLKQLQQIDGTLSTLEMQREAIEGASTNTAVLTTMKNAADSLKIAHQNMNVDQVHDIMEDISEQQEIARELSEAISSPISIGQSYDEDELEQELERLEQEALDEELLKINPVNVDVPVPSGELAKAKKVPKKRKEEEDDDMKELEMWAS